MTSTKPLIDAVWATRTVELLERGGTRADQILRQVGIRRRILQDPDARIPVHKHVAMLEAAAKCSGDSSFGLHLGEILHPREAGIIGYIALSSSTLGAALANIARYLHVHCEASELKVHSVGGFARLSNIIVVPDGLPAGQDNEFGQSLLLRYIRIATGMNSFPECVHFEHPEPKDTSEHKRIFGAPVLFGQPTNMIVLRQSLLARPLITADSDLLRILVRCCEQILESRPVGDELPHQVQHLVAKHLPSGGPRVEAVAGELGMSVRTLSRRLRERGLGYRRMVDDLRRRLTLEYLKDTDLRVSEIAYLVGYSEVSAFTHAFRRWTGLSPSAHRSAK